MSVRCFLAFAQMDAASTAKDLFIVSALKGLRWMELAVCVWVRFMNQAYIFLFWSGLTKSIRLVAGKLALNEIFWRNSLENIFQIDEFK